MVCIFATLTSAVSSHRNRCSLFSLYAGLAVPTVGVNAFATASKYVDKVIVVKYVLIIDKFSVQYILCG